MFTFTSPLSAIFISHSSKDNAQAAELKAWLAAHHYDSVFLDFDPEAGIPAGRDWEQELYAKLRQCRAVIALVSEGWTGSKWCFAEITQARALGKEILPLKLGDVSVPAPLDRVQVVDLRANPAEAFARLERGLAEASFDHAAMFQWDRGRVPYPGLMRFDGADAAVYFGRDQEVQHAIETLQRMVRTSDHRMLVTLGASGAGKSSLVRAGVLPRLARDPAWIVAPVFQPRGRPFDELAGALVALLNRHGKTPDRTVLANALRSDDAASQLQRLGIAIDIVRRAAAWPDATLLLTVDQLEELFLPGAEEEARRFLQCVATVSAKGALPLRLLATMRSDFLERFQRSVPVEQGIFDTITVEAMPRTRVREIIEKPAEVAGITIGPELVETMIEDASGPEALPLVAFMLRRLWDDGRQFTRDRYAALGGLRGAIKQSADALFRAVPAVEQAALRRAFRSLVRISEDSKGYVRRPANWSDLPAAAYPILERFVAERLLVSAGDEQGRTIEIAHEALLGQSETLRTWLGEDERLMRWRGRLEVRLADWKDKGEDTGALLQGRQLDEAQDWLASEGEQLGAAERAYIERSAAERDRNVRASRRRRQIALASGAAAFVAMTGLALWAMQQKRVAESAARNATVLRLAAEGQSVVAQVRPGNQLLGALQVLAAHRLQPGVEPYFALQGTAKLLEGTIRIMQAPGAVRSMALSLDGTRLVLGNEDATLQLWDVASARPIGEPWRGHAAPVSHVTFSPDGRRIASSGDGELRLWDALSGRSIGVLLRGYSGTGAAFSPDGRRIAAPGKDNTLRLWEADDGKPIGEPSRGHSGSMSSVAFSPDGMHIVTGSWDNTLRLWDAASGKPIGEPWRGHSESVTSVAFSPDGKFVASGGLDSTLRRWEAQSGRPIGAPLRGQTHLAGVWHVSFSPDGRHIVSEGSSTLQLWDAESGKPIGQPMRGHAGLVSGVAFTRDGKHLISAGADTTLRLWPAAEGTSIAPPFQGHEDEVLGVSFSPDGKRIVSGSQDGTLRIWDAASGKSIGGPLNGHTARVNSVAFSPDGERVVSGSNDMTLRLWEVASGRPLGAPWLGHAGSVSSVAFSRDGKHVVSGSDDATLRLWAAAGGDSRGAPLRGHTGPVTSVAFSPDGKRIVSADEEGTLRLWEVDGAKAINEPRPAFVIRSAAFSPDGKRIVSGGADGAPQLWDAAGGESIGEAWLGHAGSLESVAYSPDGKTIVSGSIDRTLRLWEAATGKSIGEPLRGHTEDVTSVAFSPDGKRVVSGSRDKTLRVWPVLDAWADELCAKLPRNMTPREWKESVGDLPYVVQCPNLPVPSDSD